MRFVRAAALAAALMLLSPGAAALAAPSPLLSVSPAVAEAEPGRPVPVTVTVGVPGTVTPQVYAYDPRSGSLEALPTSEIRWVHVRPSSATVAPGAPGLFAVSIRPPEAPATDTYLAVVWSLAPADPPDAGAPAATAATALRVAGTTVFALRGREHGPEAEAVHVRVSGPWLAFGAGTWSVRVDDPGPGWVAPIVQASVDASGPSARSALPPVLPGRTAVASVALHPLPPGLHRVRIAVGGQVFSRPVLVLPPGAVGGAAVGAGVGLLAGAAGAVALRRRAAA